MPSDKQNAEFMYAMLKQLDLKYIDWTRIAAENNITNGHAARMRFSRYRAAMEGTKPSPRGEASSSSKDGKARPKGAAGKKRKRAKCEGETSGEDDEESVVKKREEGETELEGRPSRRVKVEEGVKEGVGSDEDDVPIRLRVKKAAEPEIRLEVEPEVQPDVKEEEQVKEEGQDDSLLEGIPMVKEETDG